MVKTCASDLKLLGSSPTSVRVVFPFPLFHLNALDFHSVLLNHMRRCFTVSFRRDVKLSVPGDLARLAGQVVIMILLYQAIKRVFSERKSASSGRKHECNISWAKSYSIPNCISKHVTPAKTAIYNVSNKGLEFPSTHPSATRQTAAATRSTSAIMFSL